MKFLPEQKNKRWWSAALLLISGAGIIYFNFFAGPPRATPRPLQEAPSGTPSAKPAAKKSQGGLLPYGTAIETAVLEQEKFKALQPAAPLSVSEEELGKDDLFAR